MIKGERQVLSHDGKIKSQSYRNIILTSTTLNKMLTKRGIESYAQLKLKQNLSKYIVTAFQTFLKNENDPPI